MLVQKGDHLAPHPIGHPLNSPCLRSAPLARFLGLQLPSFGRPQLVEQRLCDLVDLSGQVAQRLQPHDTHLLDPPLPGRRVADAAAAVKAMPGGAGGPHFELLAGPDGLQWPVPKVEGDKSARLVRRTGIEVEWERPVKRAGVSRQHSACHYGRNLAAVHHREFRFSEYD